VKTIKFAILKGGEIRFIHDDELRPILVEGTAHVQRASHVEPSIEGTTWTADMRPVGGGILGPFNTKQEALDAEVNYLNTNLATLDLKHAPTTTC
jgi:hypothetical protein